MKPMVTQAVDQDFLESLRKATEFRWRDHVPRDHRQAGVGGLDWHAGTRWRGGMTTSEIVAAEQRFGLVFPPDYRQFLATLHTPDPPMIGARFEGAELVPSTGRMFPDWTGDPGPIESAIAWPLDELTRSIEHDDRWHPGWGARPRSPRQRGALIRRLAAAGPQLVPVFGHRYLVGPTDQGGNPVLSIYGSDVIVYARDLGSYLSLELGVAPKAVVVDPDVPPAPIPFWQDVIEGLPCNFG